MFTDVLNKKEDNIAHDDDGDDDENRLYPRFSSILSIGSSLIGASIEIAWVSGLPKGLGERIF